MFDSNLNRKIKVLLVSPLPSNTAFGGIGSWTVRFVESLKQNKNVNVRIVDSTPIDEKGNDIARSKNIFKKIICNLKVLKKINKELNEFKPDIIHLNSSCTRFACARDYLFLKTFSRRKIPSILHCRCNIEDQINGSKFGLFFFKRNIKISSCVLTLNRESNRFVNSFNNAKPECLVIPNFLQKNYIVRHKIINEHIENVSFVGHLVKEKGIEEIIFLAKEFPNLHFTLVSGYTEQYQSNNGFPKNIKITGNIPLDSVIRELDKSDVFLFPTHSEGFSNALLEAMARGVPVVTTNVGANIDMLESKGGIIVEPKSSNQLKSALMKIDDKLIRKEMSEWSINKVKYSYTEEVVLNRIVSIYYDLLEAKID